MSNTLAAMRPELIAEWSEENGELKPTMISIGSHKKVLWRCKRGHEWTAAALRNMKKKTWKEYISLPTAIFGRGDFFILRASGNSMIEAGMDNPLSVILLFRAKSQNGIDILLEMMYTLSKMRNSSIKGDELL